MTTAAGIHRVCKLSDDKAVFMMLAHALRQINAVNVDPSKKHLNQRLAGCCSLEEGLKLIQSKIAEHGNNGRRFRQKDGVRALDLLFTGSPGALEKLSPAHQAEYFSACLDWSVERYGGGDRSNIIAAVLHLDEKTPHIQVIITPLIKGRLIGNELIGNMGAMSRTQDEFYEKVSSKFGLGRGVKKSGARHISNLELYRRAAESLEEIRSDKWPALRPLPTLVPALNTADLVRPAKREARKQYVEELEITAAQNLAAAEKLKQALAGQLAEPQAWQIRRTDLREQQASIERRQAEIQQQLQAIDQQTKAALDVQQAAQAKADEILEQAAEHQKAAAAREAAAASLQADAQKRLEAAAVHEADVRSTWAARVHARATELSAAALAEARQAKAQAQLAQNQEAAAMNALEAAKSALATLHGIASQRDGLALQLRSVTQQRDAAHKELATINERLEQARLQGAHRVRQEMADQKAKGAQWAQKLLALIEEAQKENAIREAERNRQMRSGLGVSSRLMVNMNPGSFDADAIRMVFGFLYATLDEQKRQELDGVAAAMLDAKRRKSDALGGALGGLDELRKWGWHQQVPGVPAPYEVLESQLPVFGRTGRPEGMRPKGRPLLG